MGGGGVEEELKKGGGAKGIYIDNLKSLKENCIPKKMDMFLTPPFKLWVNTTKLRVEKMNRSELGTGNGISLIPIG